MKQVVKKSLGTAALGAAFVAAGAGTASAAPIGVLGPVGETATGAAGALPVQDATKGLPGGLSDAVTAVHETLTGGKTSHDLGKPLSADSKSGSEAGSGQKGSSAPGSSMLGGLPLGQGGLPTG